VERFSLGNGHKGVIRVSKFVWRMLPLKYIIKYIVFLEGVFRSVTKFNTTLKGYRNFKPQ